MNPSRTDNRQNAWVRPCTAVWITLMLLTVAVLAAGQAGLQGGAIVSVILVTTWLKTQMVADFFMGLKRTGGLWRIGITLYLLLVTGLIGLAYRMAGG